MKLTALPGKIRLPRRRSWRILTILTLVVLLSGSGLAWWSSRADDLPDGVVFTYGDQTETVENLQDRIQTLKALYGVQPPDAQDTVKSEAFRRDTAKAVAVGMVLERAARDRGIVIADKAAQDVLTRFISERIGEGPDARSKFVQALGTTGTSEDAVLDEIKRQLAVSQLFDSVTKGSSVSDIEVADAFAQRKEQLGNPERRQITNIVVRTKEDADQVLADLNAGTPFETLVAQRSLDGATRDKGGDLGQVTAAQLEDGYAKAAFAVPAGGLFGPTQTTHGWNVGRVRQVLPPQPAVFDQVKDQLKQQLVLEKALATWREWLGAKLVGADVRYADAYRPADPSAPPQQAPGWSPSPGQIPGQAPGHPQPPR
ncbi:peptidyl-prolyl cis-trans isomerase C [Amycolatopsis marina]|uniref:Peptidyl-prolyl cis-trans isomerase C n=1 Tax=Amycolatopsis marina TaxID=490629 RepID=A0A1I1BT78_9PSEU|nr:MULTISPECIES: peptidyl-prolyl cis-trans isomerase [Amycolatopsis]SFB53491.1 peptidyl-prolyl cis-trans isomerase C [Amycolatopsis marina]